MKLVIVEMGGSSPLARGPRRTGRPGVIAFRLIPARAGTTAIPPDVNFFVWAHPRSRGDHPFGSWFGVGGLGSSPLARGPRGAQLDTLSGLGLIPARAGTTHAGHLQDHAREAHPRSRGDHRDAARGLAVEPGSSPLARGPPSTIARVTGAGGLIPARAGTTCARRLWLRS